MQLVFYVNGLVCALMGALMLAPAALDPRHAGPFLHAAFCAALLGGTVSAAARGRRAGFRARHAFALTTGAWLTAAGAAALPFAFFGLRPADAVFESMSGLTTTGSTVLTGLDALAPALLIWRAMLQWIGGIGIIVTGIAVLPFLRVGGMQLFRAESSDTAEKELASAARFAAATLWIYAGLTLLCTLAYEAGGMTPFDAALHAMTTVSTGGFSTHDASMGFFDQPAVQWTAVVFMLSGSLPFVWYVRVLNRGALSSEQVGVYLGSLAVIVGLLALWLAARGEAAPLDALRLAAFNVVSVVTTTGFASADYTLWGAAPVAVFFVITFFGGCTGSTSGGFKAMRLILVLKALPLLLARIHRPRRVGVLRFEGRRVDDAALDGVIAFTTFFLLSFAALAVTLGMLGLDLATSVSGAVTALANVGPGVGEMIGPAGSFAALSDAAKWVLSAGMLLGRLEVLTVIVLFTPGFLRG